MPPRERRDRRYEDRRHDRRRDPHDVSIEGRGVDEEGETVGEGGGWTFRAELRPGEYDSYCSVPGLDTAGWSVR
jgi:hypothetical protein